MIWDGRSFDPDLVDAMRTGVQIAGPVHYVGPHARCLRAYADRGRIVERLLAENIRFRELLTDIDNELGFADLPHALELRIEDALAVRNTFISDEDTETD